MESSCTAILNANPYDEEALSIKRTITGATDELPQSKRDKKRLAAESKPEPVKARASASSIPEPAAYAAPSSSEPMAEAAPQPSPEPPVVMHAATIARLEAWLRTIQTNRRTASERM